jgi:hypothetical protein
MITSRLMPGLRVEGLTISLEYSSRPGDEGRTRYQYYLDFADGTRYEADDLQSGVGSHSLRYGFEGLLGFIESAADHFSYFKEDKLENYGPIFTLKIDSKLWSDIDMDEIAMLRAEIEENPNLIEE